MLSKPLPRRALALLLALSVASGCAKQVIIEKPTPPVADVEALIQPKPKPTGDIVNDDTASAKHSEAIETWGERLSAAGGSLCRWLKDTGAELPFDCPKP